VFGSVRGISPSGAYIMIRTSSVRTLCCAAAALGLSGCGGEIGGTVTGMGTERSLTLLNNGTDSLTVTSNGPFAFVELLQAQSAYDVSIMTQPAGQVCAVADGSGVTNEQADSIDTVRVTCANSASITGTVSGLLEGTAVILSNGSARLTVTVNGAFAFPGIVAAGTAYDVLVATRPSNANCAVVGGSGIFVLNVATNIQVTCSGVGT
jgi:hypothetical protein